MDFTRFLRLHAWPDSAAVRVPRITENRSTAHHALAQATCGSDRRQDGSGRYETGAMADPGVTSNQPQPTQETLRAIEQQLRSHSALEDLGPLFAPQAQGRQPSAQPSPPNRKE